MNWLKSLDRILRGEATRPDVVKRGGLDVPIVGMGILLVLLAMFYGACMGSYSLFKEGPIQDGYGRLLQVVASTFKVPALFALTLLVTFPSLYVFNALVGSRLNLPTMLRLLVASLAVNLAVLASMGPITAFFSVSTTSYPFMKLFNVAVFGIAGVLGLAFLVQTLNRLSVSEMLADAAPGVDAGEREATQGEVRPHETASDAGHDLDPGSTPPDETKSDVPPLNATESQSESEPKTEGDHPSHTASDQPTDSAQLPALTGGLADAEATDWSDLRPDAPVLGALDRPDGHVLSSHVRTVFRVWIVVFGLVGAQMGWVLRPFIGNPDLPFSWFRARESNIFQAILDALGRLLLGN